jgi:hypothetical protein
MKGVEIEGKDYRLAALPLKVLVLNWAFLVAAIVALFRVGRLFAQLVREGGQDRSQLLALLSEEGFPDLVGKALSGLSQEQLESLLNLVWESVRIGTPTLTRDAWDDLLTVPVFVDVIKAFFAAQGLEFKKDGDPGEAKPETTPAT